MSRPHTIRHELPDARWPSAAEARAARLFSPLRIGRLTAATRSWVPAMVPWRASDDGFVTDDVLDWYARFAAGRPGVLVVEATGIRDVPSGPLLRIGHDRFLPGLRRLVDAVRQASRGETLLFIQVIDFLGIRRRPEKAKFFGRFLTLRDGHRHALTARGLLAPDADEAALRTTLADLDDAVLRDVLTPREYRDYAYGQREEVNDLHLPHIAELPRVLPGLFADA
ncbi:MAG: NADH:flavin oxidoreductase, partial [Planctomycetes bacterium]|nr:NADH:flavin oxidoreductase [Planctomycetota bacterium]